MKKKFLICLVNGFLFFVLVKLAGATPIFFSNPDQFSGTEKLIDFENTGSSSSSEINMVDFVGFTLLERETLINTGYAPTLASATNSTYSREFPPDDGRYFLNMINFQAFNVDL